MDYYAPENDIYMSNSQWKHWQECPARAKARFVDHTYSEPVTQSMAIGSLIDALLLEPEKESTVLEQYADLLTSKAKGKAGTPLASTLEAYQIAERVRRSAQVMAIIERSEKQVEGTFKLAGMQWKYRIDLLDPTGYIWDLKTTANAVADAYVPRLGMRGNFIAQWQYSRQLALYREAEKQRTGKQNRVGIITADKAMGHVFIMPWSLAHYHQIDAEIVAIEAAAPEIRAMIDGQTPTWRCEKCQYCAETRTDFIVTYHDPERTSF
jgi:hypothetical protein